MSNRTAELVKIGELWLPGIYNYSCKSTDIDSDDTMRNEAGVMIRLPIRKSVKKLSIAMRLEMSGVQTVSELIADDYVEMLVFCPSDPNADDNGYCTSEFYVSEKTINLLSLNGESWWEMIFNAIEK